MPHFGRFDMPVAALASPQTITVGSSPFAYTSAADGVLVINGGTVSLVTYTRNGIAVTLGIVGGTIPVFKGDVVTVTWAISAPTMTLIQSRAA